MGKMSNMTDGTKLSTDDEETPRVSSTLQSLLVMPKLMQYAELLEKLELKHTNTYSAILASIHLNSPSTQKDQKKIISIN